MRQHVTEFFDESQKKALLAGLQNQQQSSTKALQLNE
jgi:hypothetical protein